MIELMLLFPSRYTITTQLHHNSSVTATNKSESASRSDCLPAATALPAIHIELKCNPYTGSVATTTRMRCPYLSMILLNLDFFVLTFSCWPSSTSLSTEIFSEMLIFTDSSSLVYFCISYSFAAFPFSSCFFRISANLAKIPFSPASVS